MLMSIDDPGEFVHSSNSLIEALRQAHRLTHFQMQVVLSGAY